MKKIFLSLLLMAAFINASAITYTSKATLTLTSSSSESANIIIGASASLTEGINAGYCGLDNQEGKVVDIYAIYSSNYYSTFGTKDVKGMAIGIKTNADTEYTISFSNVSGSETIQLYDALLDSIIDIVAAGTYEFTAPANNTAINDRFRIFKPFTPDAGDLNICHQYGKLTINNNPYTTNIVVKNSSDVVVIDKAPRTTPQVIDLSALPAGRYTVEIGGQTLIIDVK